MMGNGQNKEENKEQTKDVTIESNKEEKKKIPTIPQNAKTIIIVLGQRLLPTGKPHQWLIERIDKAYSLLTENKLDIDTTYFIVSGSDVSNFRYQQENHGKLPEPRHISEAQMMYNLMIDLHKTNNHSSDENKDEDNNNNDDTDDFGKHIILEDQAMTTTQNFFHAFQMIDASKLRNKIEQIYIVTSDFHMKRSKYNFDAMFYNNDAQIIGNSKDFKYEDRVHFAASETKWDDEKEKVEKEAKEEQYYNLVYLQQQTITTAQQLWMSLSK